MSTTTTDIAATARGVQLSEDDLVALKPHVITLTDGRLDRERTLQPRSAKGFATTEADIDEIFATHLPAFMAAKGLGTVPIVLYAHGGLVDVEAGFATAHRQVQWWKDNGVYPIHFVWKTGVWSSIWDAVGRWVPGGSRGVLEELKDGVVENAARMLGGERVWLDMKLDAAASSDQAGGARLFAKKLSTWMKSNPNRATLHAVGHSAGSIFHSHLIAAAVDVGVKRFETVTLLAPAVRMDTFRSLVAAHADRIGSLTVFTMSESAELDDTCLGIYAKSLLYLVSASFEREKGTPILGLAKDIAADAVVSRLLKGPGGELVLTPNKNSKGRSASTAASHGDFDTDQRTMESVLLRVTGLSAPLERFPAGARTIDPAEGVATPASPRGISGKTALCVGIDEYASPADRLQGAVADSQEWGRVLEKAGFDVTPLTNGDATRAGILGSLFKMITTAAPGDILVFQYAGHGTSVPDADADGDEADRSDEAICPVDFRSGELIVDDDLAELWDLIGDDVTLTIFFDSCHSGGANRDVTPDAESLPRGVALTAQDEDDYRVARGLRAPRGRGEAAERVKASETAAPAAPRSASPQKREVLFAACRPDELAWETRGHGDFTAAVAPLLAQSIGRVSNSTFFEAIRAGFDAHRQHPSFDAPMHAEAPLLAAAVTPGAQRPATPPAEGGVEASPDAIGATAREAAIAQVLRGLAALIEG